MGNSSYNSLQVKLEKKAAHGLDLLAAYTLLLALYVTKLADPLYVAFAWIFVATRYAHAWIHCTFNKVMRRFQAYAVGYFVLAAMWARFAFDLLVSR